MGLWTDFVRAIGTGVGINGVGSSLKRHVDDVEVTTANSDSDGKITFSVNGHPGPVYHVETSGGETKRRSSKAFGTIFPAEVPYALIALGDGVVDGEEDELEVYGDSSGRQVKVRTGVALVKGHIYRGVTEQTLAIGANATGDPRIDRIILRLTRPGQTEEGKLEAVVLAGTAAASPSAPSLTQTDATWEITLARVAVASGASTITAGNVTNERTFTLSEKQDQSDVLDEIAGSANNGFDFFRSWFRIANSAQATPDTATNTSMTDYVQAIAITTTLPAGTWNVVVEGGCQLRHSATGNVNLRINIGGDTGEVVGGSVGSAATERQMFISTHTDLNIAAGSLTVKVEYKAGTASAGTVTALNAWIKLIAIRVAE